MATTTCLVFLLVGAESLHRWKLHDAGMLSASTALPPAAQPTPAPAVWSYPGQAGCMAGKFAKPKTGWFTGAAVACIFCPFGRFSARAGALQCIACPKGKFQATGTEQRAGCARCARGRTTFPILDALVTSVDGAEAHAKAADRAALASGTCAAVGAIMKHGGKSSSSAADAVASAPCKPTCKSGTIACIGWGSPGTGHGGRVVCQACPAGRFEKGGRLCAACPAGRFSSAGSASAAERGCAHCTAGRSTHGYEGATLCSPARCAEGHAPAWDPVRRAAACARCATGHQCVGGALSAVPCAVGRYAPRRGMGGCLSCPAGRTSAAWSNAPPQKPLPDGSDGAAIKGASACAVCGAGRSNRMPGSICHACPAGRFAPGAAALPTNALQLAYTGRECPLCAAGAFSARGSAKCTACPKGRLSSGPARIRCSGTCVPGTYARGTLGNAAFHRTALVVAAAGGRSGGMGGMHCVPCPTGRYGSTKGLSDKRCTAPCFAGYLCSPGSIDGFGRRVETDSPVPCGSDSTYCPKGAVRPLTPAPGFYAAGEGKGRAAATPEAQQHDACSATGRSTGCRHWRARQCTAGAFCTGGVLRPCPRGSAQSSAGSAGCVRCPAGHYSALEGTTACAGCPRGKFASRAGANGCVGCPAGKYTLWQEVARGGAKSCTSCTAGRFRSRAEAAAAAAGVVIVRPRPCAACVVGRFARSLASASCMQCTPGSWTARGGGAVACSKCEAGRWAHRSPPTPVGRQHRRLGSNTPASGCYSCPDGRYQAHTGGSACAMCPPGKHSSRPGARACASCAAGRGSVYWRVLAVVLDDSRATAVAAAAAAAAQATVAAGGGWRAEAAAAEVAAAVRPRSAELSTKAGAQGSRGGNVCARPCGPSAYIVDIMPRVPGVNRTLAEAGATGSSGDVHTVCGGCGEGRYSLAGMAPGCAPCPAGKFRDCFAAGAGMRCSAAAPECALCPAGKTTPGPGGWHGASASGAVSHSAHALQGHGFGPITEVAGDARLAWANRPAGRKGGTPPRRLRWRWHDSSGWVGGAGARSSSDCVVSIPTPLPTPAPPTPPALPTAAAAAATNGTAHDAARLPCPRTEHGAWGRCSHPCGGQGMQARAVTAWTCGQHGGSSAQVARRTTHKRLCGLGSGAALGSASGCHCEQAVPAPVAAAHKEPVLTRQQKQWTLTKLSEAGAAYTAVAGCKSADSQVTCAQPS